jgi:hypothetical protein
MLRNLNRLLALFLAFLLTVLVGAIVQHAAAAEPSWVVTAPAGEKEAQTFFLNNGQRGPLDYYRPKVGTPCDCSKTKIVENDIAEPQNAVTYCPPKDRPRNLVECRAK